MDTAGAAADVVQPMLLAHGRIRQQQQQSTYGAAAAIAQNAGLTESTSSSAETTATVNWAGTSAQDADHVETSDAADLHRLLPAVGARIHDGRLRLDSAAFEDVDTGTGFVSVDAASPANATREMMENGMLQSLMSRLQEEARRQRRDTEEKAPRTWVVDVKTTPRTKGKQNQPDHCGLEEEENAFPQKPPGGSDKQREDMYQSGWTRPDPCTSFLHAWGSQRLPRDRQAAQATGQKRLNGDGKMGDTEQEERRNSPIGSLLRRPLLNALLREPLRC
jgi:hypothetical protein